MGWLLPPATGEGGDGGDAFGDSPIPTFPHNCRGRSQPTTPLPCFSIPPFNLRVNNLLRANGNEVSRSSLLCPEMKETVHNRRPTVRNGSAGDSSIFEFRTQCECLTMFSSQAGLDRLWLKCSTLFAPPFAPFTTLFAQCLNQFPVRQFRHFLVESQRGEPRVIVCRRDQSIQ